MLVRADSRDWSQTRKVAPRRAAKKMKEGPSLRARMMIAVMVDGVGFRGSGWKGLPRGPTDLGGMIGGVWVAG
jgi:hypothetical protein